MEEKDLRAASGAINRGLTGTAEYVKGCRNAFRVPEWRGRLLRTTKLLRRRS